MRTANQPMPPQAADLVIRACNDHHVGIADVQKHWFLRSPAESAARVAAMAALRDHTTDGNPTWTVRQIAEWFGVNRRNVDRILLRYGHFTARRKGTLAVGSASKGRQYTGQSKPVEGSSAALTDE